MICSKKIGDWSINVGPKKVISPGIVRNLSNFLTGDWKKAVTQDVAQPWWSLINFEVPSPLIRVDMAPIYNGRSPIESVYEVEARPAGIGLFPYLVPEMIPVWKEIFRNFSCKGIVNIKSTIQDDQLASQILGFPYFTEMPSGEGPFWIRSNSRDGFVADQEKLALAPIRLDGDKNYLIKLGLAAAFNLDEIDWAVPFVVKPTIGSRMEGVEIYLPNGLRKDFKGSSTRSKIIKTVSGKSYLKQDFIPPERENLLGKDGWTIWRLYFGWLGDSYKFVGGLWNWRPTVRIHGASDAVMGPVLL